MADLSQTPANVTLGGAGAQVIPVQVNGAVTQGEPGYYDSGTQKYGRADANDTETTAAASGIFLTAAAADGDYVAFQKSGPINVGATLVVGTMYYVSGTVGKISDSAPTTGWYSTPLGVATSTSVLQLNPTPSGAQVA